MASMAVEAGAAATPPAADDTEDWREGLKQPRPKVGIFVTWLMISVMVVSHCVWVSAYTSHNSQALTWCAHKYPDGRGEYCAPTWVAFLSLQLIAMAYSYGVGFLFPMFPTVMRLPFMLFAFTPAFIMYAWPFLFTDFGVEFAQRVPHWILAAWSWVRLCIETSIQTHHAMGGQGVSWWLLWPCQKAPKPYTMTYPFCGCKLTRTRGGNCDAAGSFLLGIPTVIAFAVVNSDHDPGVVTWAYIYQIWMFIYLWAGPFLHFFMGMPDEKNILDGKCTPERGTRMYALTAGSLGVVAFMAGSYAVIHFAVFVRKMALPWIDPNVLVTGNISAVGL